MNQAWGFGAFILGFFILTCVGLSFPWPVFLIAAYAVMPVFLTVLMLGLTHYFPRKDHP